MSQSSRKALLTGSGQRTQISDGDMVRGTVIGNDLLHGWTDVKLDNTGRTVTCVVAANVIASLVGLSPTGLPGVGTRVAVHYSTGTSFILGTVPTAMGDKSSAGRSKSLLNSLKTGEKLSDYKTPSPKATVRGTAPLAGSSNQDGIAGEYDMTNLLGVGVQFLTHLCRLTAGGRATVEALLLNDMVRIVSGNFAQMTDFGDYHIFNDGRLNVEWHGTSYEHETYGALKPKNKKVPTRKGGNSVELDSAEICEIGRHRFSQYIGFLGDFVHTLVTDPPAVLGQMTASALRSGKSRIQQATDGTVLIQSIAEISIERVVRIPVPVRIRRPEDKRGMKRADFDNLEGQFLKIWEQPKNPTDLSRTAFQLRDYSRWLSNYYLLARFHQADRDFHMPKEKDVPAPSWTSKEKDRESANSGAPEYRDAYACIRIMRDGAIVNFGAQGEAMVMSNGSGYISVPRGLHLEAGEDITMRAGQNIILQARRSLEAIALGGGVTLRGRAWFKVLSEVGSIWFKSDAKDPKRDASKPAKKWEGEDPEPEVLEAGIVFDSSASGVRVEAAGNVAVNINSTAYSPGDEEQDGARFIVVARGVALKATHGILRLIANQKDIVLKTARDLLLSVTRKWHTQATDVLIGNALSIRGALTKFVNLRARTGDFKLNVSGPERLGSPRNCKTPFCPHENHIAKVSDGLDFDIDQPNNANTAAAQTDPQVKPLQDQWEHEKHTPPKADNNDPRALVESLTQQDLRLHAARQGVSLGEISEEQLQPASAKRTKTTPPWPGKGAQQLQTASSGNDLDVPTDATPSPKSASLSAAARVFRFVKKS